MFSIIFFLSLQISLKNLRNSKRGLSLLWWLNLWKYDRGQFISSFGSWWKSSQFSRSWAPPLKFHTIAWTTIFVQKLRSIFPFWMSKHLIKAELLQEGIFFLIHLFARDILVMKNLEIEKTKPTFIISVLKVEY